MAVACPALASGDAFLSSLLRHIDCQGRTLGLAGYDALAGANSPLNLALTGVLVIFVALFGLRMALGETTTLRDGVLAVVKIGIVLTLATSWPAYQGVIYGFVVNGPAQVASLIQQSNSSPSRDLINRLQTTDQSIVRLTNLGTGREEFATLPPAAGAPPGEASQRFPIADNPAFGWARVLFLSSTVAAFAVVRLTAGLLLALTPLFAGLLLFGMARSLFVGWARALVFSFLGSIAVAVLLGVELALLEPWLGQTIALRNAQAVTAAAPVELLVLCLGFTAALAGALGLLLRLSFMVHVSLPQPVALFGRGPALETPADATPDPTRPWEPAGSDRAPSRALVVADAVSAAQRRESARPAPSRSGSTAALQASAAAHGPKAAADDLIIPNFGPASRRARPRTSLGSRIRDRRT